MNHNVAALAGSVCLALCSLPLAAAEGPRQQGPKPGYSLAMCSNGNFYGFPDYPVKMLDAGARMCRLDFTFSMVRRRPGNDPEQWDWSHVERLRAVKKKHPELECLMLLGYSLPWAEDEKTRDPKPLPKNALPPINGPQAGIDVRPVEDPRNLYGHYVYEIVRRYKDLAKHWESWNEPDLPGRHFWKLGGKEFFKYQRVCYLAAKKADPECKVLFAGLCYGTIEGYLAAHKLKAPTPWPPKECFFEEYLKECVKDPEAKQNHYYFDIMSQHSYSRASDAYDYVAIDNKLMQDYLGEVKPTWMTECGVTDTRDTKPGDVFACSPAEYCDYILQSFAWAKMAGVEKLFHFQLDNSNGHGLYTGLMADLGQPKPALTAYRDVLARELATARFIRQLHGSKGVDFLAGNSAFQPTWKAGYNLFEFQSGDGRRRVLIAFADTDGPVSGLTSTSKSVTARIPATKAKATRITRDNQRTEIAAAGGFYEVRLDGATNTGGWPAVKDSKEGKALGVPEHLVGGATIVLVEE